MYLTKFPINMTLRESRRMLSSPYRLHAAIEGNFPEGCSHTDEGRVLWRVDRNPNGSANLYIVSPMKPSLVGLDEQIGWPDCDRQWSTRDYGPLLEQIVDGQTYGFRLVANPVISRKAIVNERGDSKRIPHLTLLQQSSWLVGKAAYQEAGIEPPEFLARQDSSRAERNGFVVTKEDGTGGLKLMLSDSRKISFTKGSDKKVITLLSVRYEGILEVIDADRLRHALTFGIGHAKGFGCGMLTIVPLEL